MTTKKSASGAGGGASPAKKRTAKRSAPSVAAEAKRPARRAKTGAQPRIRASHSAVPDAVGSSAGAPRRPISVDTGHPKRRAELKHKAPSAPLRKAPLAGPKRAVPRRPVSEVAPEASREARELALGLAAAAIDKKALGIEILDVTGKVDYADFLVVMTGRSDRHVHAIATGIEEAMRRKKHAPLSMEGLSSATWVLIDFGDVVVHVFQEEARAIYDIEGLWIDAGRVPVPVEMGPQAPPNPGPAKPGLEGEKVEGAPATRAPVD